MTTIPQPAPKRQPMTEEERKAKRRAYYLAHADHIKEQTKARYRADPEAAKAYAKEYREKNKEKCKAYRAANAEKIHARSKQFFIDNPDYRRCYSAANRDRLKMNAKRYCFTHAAVIRLRFKRYYETHRDYERARHKAYNKANPHFARMHSHNRRARIRCIEGRYTDADIERQLRMQRRKCWWCGVKLKGKSYHIDHRIPLARGGSNGPENIVISCPTCNLRKGSKTPQEFAGRLL